MIRNKVEAEKSRPVTRSSTLQRELEHLESAPGTSDRVLPSTKPTTANRETTVDRKPSVIRGRLLVTRSAIFKPNKSKTISTILPEERKQTAKRRGRPPNSSSTMPKVSSDESYAPPVGRIGPSLNESCIAKRLSRCRGTTGLPKTPTNSPESSSECEQSTSDSNREDLDPPLYRKSHSVPPSLELRTGGATDGSPPNSTPPSVRAPKPWFPSLQEPYVDIFVDGDGTYNGRGEPRAGIGVWFSRPARGQQTNNAAEIEAAVKAAQRAQDAGIKKLRINTDYKYLVSSATEWIPTWEKNDWKTAENKPVKTRNEFEKLKKAL